MKKLLPLINPASNWRQALVFLYRTNIFIEGDNSALQHEAINLSWNYKLLCDFINKQMRQRR
jgi:hypothetical protein